MSDEERGTGNTEHGTGDGQSLRESKAEYVAGEIRKPVTLEEKLAWFEDVKRFADQMRAKYGTVNVTELMRDVRGEDEDLPR